MIVCYSMQFDGRAWNVIPPIEIDALAVAYPHLLEYIVAVWKIKQKPL